MANSGDDPLADYQNMLGLQGLTGPNPYLEFQGQIPLAGYAGAPVNAATGQPIQSFTDTQNASNAWNAANPAPGTTLNSSPPSAQQQALQQAAASGQEGVTSQMAGAGINSIQQANALRQQMGGMYPGGSPAINADKGSFGFGPPTYAGGGSMPTQQPTAAAPTNPYNMRQAYLQALANPGKVTTPGAVMQPGAAQTGAPQPSVLAAFLAAHPSGGSTGAGGYNNNAFFNTLNQLQAAKGATA